jgi:hypothetical protein
MFFRHLLSIALLPTMVTIVMPIWIVTRTSASKRNVPRWIPRRTAWQPERSENAGS